MNWWTPPSHVHDKCLSSIKEANTSFISTRPTTWLSSKFPIVRVCLYQIVEEFKIPNGSSLFVPNPWGGTLEEGGGQLHAMLSFCREWRSKVFLQSCCIFRLVHEDTTAESAQLAKPLLPWHTLDRLLGRECFYRDSSQTRTSYSYSR